MTGEDADEDEESYDDRRLASVSRHLGRLAITDGRSDALVVELLEPPSR